MEEGTIKDNLLLAYNNNCVCAHSQGGQACPSTLSGQRATPLRPLIQDFTWLTIGEGGELIMPQLPDML